jgi:pimeloyl-ACP methyl ester carboxylesterase
VAERLEPTPFELDGGPAPIAGEELGEGRIVILLHGLTATRRYVVHGSSALARRGHRQISYDARGHGASAPAPEGEGYGYEELAADLRAVIAARSGGEAPVLAGHSMGAHTAVNLALAGEVELSGLILICPASLGTAVPDEILAQWDRWADGLEGGGVEGFLEAYMPDVVADEKWRETIARITRDRLGAHEHPEAVARALREVPRSIPFEGLSALEALSVPTLVVASRDEADPAHPYAVAEAWAERIPGATLTSEEPGSSPLAWQGGRLSRAIADFLG